MQFNRRSLGTSISVATLAACAGSVFAAPANDLCVNAQLIVAGTPVTGTNVAAGTDGPAGACVNTGADVWYRYTHPVGSPTQTLNLSTCATTSNFDTVLRGFSGTCGALTQIGCNDDSTCTSGGTLSSMDIQVTPGATYYISVGGFGAAGATGNFRLLGTLMAPSVLGPDVIVGDMPNTTNWGTVGSIAAFSIGTTSCNIGDTDLLWISGNNQHPVIGQNLYKIENNRMELIGQSWLKHGFTALTENLCATCNGHGGAVLGVNCSDPYSSSLNGDQSRLGPRSEVNAATGFYPYPFTSPSTPATIGRRLQVVNTELGHAGATYVAETQYVTADDATFVNASGTARNGLNNVSHRRCTTTATTMSFSGAAATVRSEPALKAWQALDPTVVLNSYDYQEGTIVCRYWVGAKVVANANNTWTYNYTIFNLNSDRSAAGFTIPLSNVTTSAPFQRTPVYHSGEAASLNDAWVRTETATEVTWSTPQTYAQNQNSSALRWSTAATFSITTNTAPATGTATLKFFKPGTGSTLALANLPIPSAGTPPCAADFNHDTVVDFNDYLDFVDALSTMDPSADFNGDTLIDFNDYLDFVDALSLGC